MGIPERRAQTKEGLRTAILQAAGELFAAHGYESTSMRKIAERIGYSPTTIYLYFRDKDDLLQCLCQETFGLLAERLRNIDDPSATAIDRLKRACRAYIEFGVEHPSHYRATFMMPDRPSRGEASCESLLAAAMESYQHLRNGVLNCVSAGVFSGRDADTVTQVLWASMHGLTSLLVAKCQFPWADRETLISTLVDGMMHGLTGVRSSAAT
jgi:AcrR family transcriptional regulator